MTNIIVTSLLLLLAELLYFRIAEKYNIIDKPNHRSSHDTVTIRGGGIIFALAAAGSSIFYGFQYPFFSMGVFMIGSISFLDDIITLNNKKRLAIHLLSVFMLIIQWNLLDAPFYLIIIIIILVIGAINAYNFMDGINGITGAYSLVTLGTLYYINIADISIAYPGFFYGVLISLIIFNFFNFRKKAKCFAGDVGSISIAFIIIFLLGNLINITHNWAYTLFLMVYGLDAVSTIIFRLIRRENIFEAHRSHFYQFLANKLKMSHLLVSSGYALFQLLINLFIILFADDVFAIVSMIIVSSITFLLARFKFEGINRLIYNSN